MEITRMCVYMYVCVCMCVNEEICMQLKTRACVLDSIAERLSQRGKKCDAEIF